MTTLTERLFSIQGSLAADQQQAAKAPILPFDGWKPDRPDFGVPGSENLKNVLPIRDGVLPFKNLGTAKSDAMTARCQGGLFAPDSTGVVYIYTGDQTKLYSLINQVFTDASKSGGYGISEDQTWEFARFGPANFLATNIADPVQTIAVGETTFDDLITSSNKPKARHIAALRDFVVLGYTSDAIDGEKPERIWWSGIGDARDFDPAASTQSDFQDLLEGGQVQRIVGNVEYALIFMSHQIVRMTYVGSPLVFRFDAIDRARGTPIPNSVIALGRLTFFISEEGIFMTDGLTSTPIGHEAVDREFWDNFDIVYKSRVSSAIDPMRKLVMWSFPTTGNTTPNKIFIFNWVEKKWSYADQTIDILLSIANQGYTLDGLDSISSSLDSLPFSLDSDAYKGGEFRLGAVKTDFKLYEFDGSNLAATMTTAEFQPFNGFKSFIDQYRPIVQGDGAGTTITGKYASRGKLTDGVSFGSAGTMDAEGRITAISNSDYYHRIKVEIAAGQTWSFAQGVEIKATRAGLI